mgnify:FL=1
MPIPLLFIVIGGLGGTGMVGGIIYACRARSRVAGPAYGMLPADECDIAPEEAEAELLRKLEDGTSYQSLSAATLHSRNASKHGHSRREAHMSRTALRRREGTMSALTLQAGHAVRKITPEKAFLMVANFCNNSRVFDVGSLTDKPHPVRQSLSSLIEGAHPCEKRRLFHFTVCTRYKRRPLEMRLHLCPPPERHEGPASLRHQKQKLQNRGPSAVDFGQLVAQRAMSQVLRIAAEHSPRFLLRWHSFNFCAGGAAIIRTLPLGMKTLDEWIPLPSTRTEALNAIQSLERDNYGARPATRLTFHQISCYGRDILRGLKSLRELDILHMQLLPEHVVINMDPALELQLNTHQAMRNASQLRIGVAQLTSIDLNFLPSVEHRYSSLLTPTPRGTSGRGTFSASGRQNEVPVPPASNSATVQQLPDIFLFGCCLYEMATSRVMEGFRLKGLAKRVGAMLPTEPLGTHEAVSGQRHGWAFPARKPTPQQLNDLISVIAFICDPYCERTRQSSTNRSRTRKQEFTFSSKKASASVPSTARFLTPTDLLEHGLFTAYFDAVAPAVTKHVIDQKVQPRPTDDDESHAKTSTGSDKEYSIYDDEDEPENWLATDRDDVEDRAGEEGFNVRHPPGGVEPDTNPLPLECQELVGRTCSLKMALLDSKDAFRHQQLHRKGRTVGKLRSKRDHTHGHGHTRRYRRKSM